jgi:DNA uptake protein ComE-like DNA-binding protein
MHVPRLFPIAAATLGGLLMVGCAQPQNPDEIRRRTAQATAEIKQDAKAVAEGVSDGLKRDKPVDLNHATKDQLLRLPGVTPQRANRIIASRPYESPDELVSKHILSSAQYQRIKDRVKIEKSSPSGR